MLSTQYTVQIKWAQSLVPGNRNALAHANQHALHGSIIVISSSHSRGVPRTARLATACAASPLALVCAYLLRSGRSNRHLGDGLCLHGEGSSYPSQGPPKSAICPTSLHGASGVERKAKVVEASHQHHRKGARRWQVCDGIHERPGRAVLLRRQRR